LIFVKPPTGRRDAPRAHAKRIPPPDHERSGSGQENIKSSGGGVCSNPAHRPKECS
jgi:hypothetical protein